jgi:hypothetical protein
LLLLEAVLEVIGMDQIQVEVVRVVTEHPQEHLEAALLLNLL